MLQTKKILIVGLTSTIGGMETIMHNYIKKMDTTKYRFDFATTSETVAFSGEYIKNGSKVFCLPSFTKKPIKYYQKLKQIIKDNSYDIIHINMLSAANILPVVAANNSNSKKIIIHSHSSGLASSPFKHILHVINKGYLKKDRFTKIACGEKSGNWMFGKKTPYLILNNAVKKDLFKYSEHNRREIRKKYGIKDGTTLLGTVGRLRKEKNQIFLLKLLRQLNIDAKLMIVGEGDQRRALQRFANKNHIADKVIFVDSTDEINKYYSAFDLFLLPSLFEGVPTVLIEAQFNGLTALASDKVSDEANIGKALFLKLKEEYWIKSINELTKKRDTAMVNNKQFDISEQVRIIESIYDA